MIDSTILVYPEQQNLSVPKPFREKYPFNKTDVLKSLSDNRVESEQEPEKKAIDLFAEEEQPRKDLFKRALEIRATERQDADRENEIYQNMVENHHEKESYRNRPASFNERQKLRQAFKNKISKDYGIPLMYVDPRSKGWQVPGLKDEPQGKFFKETLLRQIYRLQRQTNGFCIASNKQLAAILGVPENVIKHNLTDFYEEGLLQNWTTGKGIDERVFLAYKRKQKIIKTKRRRLKALYNEIIEKRTNEKQKKYRKTNGLLVDNLFRLINPNLLSFEEKCRLKYYLRFAEYSNKNIMSYQNMAKELGISREQVNRDISKYWRLGYLEIDDARGKNRTYLYFTDENRKNIEQDHIKSLSTKEWKRL